MTDATAVVVYAPDLMDQSRIRAAHPGAVFVRRLEQLTTTPAQLVVVDLGRPGVLDVIGDIDAPVVGFASHVDDEVMAAARAAGCAQVLPRSRFFRSLPELVASAGRTPRGS